MSMNVLSSVEFQRLILSVGTHRKKRPLSPYECGELLERAYRTGDYTLGDLAKAVGISDTGTISNFIRLLDIVPSHRHLVDWGKTGCTIAFKSAAMLARLDEKDQDICFAAALEKTLRKIEIEQVVQIRQRSGRPICECIDEVVGMRPTVTTANVIAGALASHRLRKKLSSLSQADKNMLLKRAIDARFPNLQEYSARLGDDTFTISANDDDTNYLHSKAKTLEDTIADSIEALL
jgi:hypothetical protein